MTLNVGALILVVAAIFAGLGVLQIRAGVVFRPVVPLRRDAEPQIFWLAILANYAFVVALVWFGVKLLLQ